MIAATLAVSVWFVSTAFMSLIALAALKHGKQARKTDWWESV